jgi:hypothetical protein
MTNTAALAWVHFTNAPSELYLATTTDGAEKELTSQSAGAAIGDVAGQVISGIDAQVGDGSILTYVQITDSSGGQTINVKGGERSPTQSAFGNMNITLAGLSIPVQRGQSLNAMTAD